MHWLDDFHNGGCKFNSPVGQLFLIGWDGIGLLKYITRCRMDPKCP